MYYRIIDYIKNKYYDELSELSPSIRQATIFKYTTEEMPLLIKEGDLFAGWYGYETWDELPKVQGQVSFGESTLSYEQKALRQRLCEELKTEINFTPAHTCIDYGNILKNGLTHYISLVEDALKDHPKDDYLKAMKISLEAACNFSQRFADIAKEKMQSAEDKQQKSRFENMYSALCRVPREPAKNFLEAVQSIWIMHSLIPMAEASWASISVGRVDIYLYPFYKKHIEEGGTKEEAKGILKNLFLLLDSYGDGACAMNIGGLDENGNDILNDLSKVLIEVEKEMRLCAPIFAVRVTPNMPEEVFDSLIDAELFKIGQPTFYGELNCRKAVADRGVNIKDAIGFSVNSCMGLVVAGKEFADMWGIKFNSHLPLELALNNGEPLNANLDFDLGITPVQINDFDQLLEQYGKYFSLLLSVCATLYEAIARDTEANLPDPFLSALTDGCIENRGDRATKAKYNTVTVETMGLINTCDSLAAIKELVMDKKKYTLKELITAAKMNYEGYDDIRSELLRCKKYGMNNSEVNAIVKKVGEMVSDACKKVSHHNRMFLPSLHTIEANIEYGTKLYATLDGRIQGQPVNKNANPSLTLKKTEATSHILSATSFDQTEFSGGQPIDLYFDKEWFKTKEGRDKIKALIRTYFQFGGLQLQVNSIDVELLEKAHNNPEDYPFVIVRKGGYSVHFSHMSKENRAEFIEQVKRTEQCI